MGWIEQASSASVLEVISALNLIHSTRVGLTPCPSCGEEVRGSEDRRGPVGVRGDGKGWRCFRCDAAGDGLELATLVWTGSRLRELTPEQRSQVRDKAAAMGWCDAEDQGGGPVPRMGSGSRRSRSPLPDPGWKVTRPGSTKATKAVEPPSPGSGPMDWQPDLPERCVAQLWGPEGAQVLAYLQGRGFRESTLRDWGVGAHLIRDRSGRVVEQYVAIPVPRRDGVGVMVRFRSVPGPCLHCHGSGCRRCRGTGEVRKVYLRTPGADSVLFGVHRMDPDPSTTVIITEGELDVLALYQYGITSNVVSGTAGAGTWREEWLDTLEPFQHFILAYDDDEKGHAGAEKVAKALGLTRCSRAILPRGDAAECLQDVVSQAEVHAALDNASPLMDLHLSKAGHYFQELEELIANPGALRGLPTGSTKLDQGIGGWSPGLVVVTGDTAAGKTSAATWMGLEQALRGVPVLLTSFEQRPIGTVQKLLRARMGGDFTRYTRDQRRMAMAALDRLPLYLLDHYGNLNTTQCLQGLDYAVRRLGVRWALVDHLGFLVHGAEDERRAIEQAVRDLATFAVQREITVVLICHPNNLSVVQQRRVQLGDLKGASAIRQDAHMGLVVERLLPGRVVKHPAAAVHVDKCRSEFGMQGARLVLYYDPEACVYADTWEDTPMGRAGGGGPSCPP